MEFIDKYKKERNVKMETSKVGDCVYAEEDFIYGRIVEIDGDSAHMEFRTPGGRWLFDI